jgi:hypothetical protein
MSDDFARFLTLMGGLLTVAIVAVLVSKNANTSSVANSFFQGFASDINAAVSPVTGGGGLGSIGLNNLGIGG